MLKKFAFVCAGFLAIGATATVSGQDEITSIDFDTVPAGTQFTGPSIVLDGPVEASGVLQLNAGIVFPDGTVQTSAVNQEIIRSFSATVGLYDNRIPDFTPPNPYSEICVKSGVVVADIHFVSEPPDGGQCAAGDVGWIIERNERFSATWDEARMDCLKDGMRLLEPFEFRISCRDADTFGINDLADDWEFASNTTQLFSSGGFHSVSVPIMGSTSCNAASVRVVGNNVGETDVALFRCAR